MLSITRSIFGFDIKESLFLIKKCCAEACKGFRGVLQLVVIKKMKDHVETMLYDNKVLNPSFASVQYAYTMSQRQLMSRHKTQDGSASQEMITRMNAPVHIIWNRPNKYTGMSSPHGSLSI